MTKGCLVETEMLVIRGRWWFDGGVDVVVGEEVCFIK